jgi:hypothetical protein
MASLRVVGEGTLFGDYARSGGAQSATARSAGRSLVSWSLAESRRGGYPHLPIEI